MAEYASVRRRDRGPVRRSMIYINETAAKRALTGTRYPLAGTEYRYQVSLLYPPHARTNTYSVVATLTALTGPSGEQEQIPDLSAWGKNETDAVENLEIRLRAWLTHGDDALL